MSFEMDPRISAFLTDLGRSRLMTVDEAATFLRISRAKAYMMVKSGELPVVRMGRSVRVRPDKLVEWMDRQGGPDVA